MFYSSDVDISKPMRTAEDLRYNEEDYAEYVEEYNRQIKACPKIKEFLTFIDNMKYIVIVDNENSVHFVRVKDTSRCNLSYCTCHITGDFINVQVDRSAGYHNTSYTKDMDSFLSYDNYCNGDVKLITEDEFFDAVILKNEQMINNQKIILKYYEKKEL